MVDSKLYNKALEIALAMEAAPKDTKDLQAALNPPLAGLNYVAGGKKDQAKQLSRCTDDHKIWKASHMRHRENQILHVTTVEVLISPLNANFTMQNVATVKRSDILQKFVD